MHLYHFLPADHALDDLVQGRLKIAEIRNLNDPFELWASGQRDPKVRAPLRKWKLEMSKRFGMLCFSSDKSNPLLWSHYADRHKGICLGFRVRDALVAPIKYVEARTELRPPLTENCVRELLFTKYSGWEYEKEWRSWCRLEETDPRASDYYFKPFDDDLQIREVIVGPLCDVARGAIEHALRRCSSSIEIHKTRLAFKSFHVVKDLRGF
jgi:hypothetical protein